MTNKINELSKDLELKEKIIDLYVNQNMAKPEVAKELGLSMWILSLLLKNFDIKKSKDKQLIRRQNTCLQKYGVLSVSQREDVRQKISAANKANGSQIAEKGKVTKELRYGDAHYNNLEKNRLTKKFRYNNENYNNRNKYKETMLEKYGTDNGFKIQSTVENNLQRLLDNSEYTDLFKQVFDDRDAAIAFLNSGKYSYYDLCKLFNAPYYTVQLWATRKDLKQYINYEFDGKSHYEDEIVSFIQSLGITNIERNTKKYLDGQEIDIYIPEKHLGVEFNGTFWHSDLHKENKYHFNKSLLAQENGIRLIHIYQYEWDDSVKQEKIKSLLRIALGKVERRIYARECEIRTISNNEARILNDKVHLQGHRMAHITYGLFYHDELVQLMSFSKHKKYQWEIIRGCPGSNNIVIGGVSKLFKHFIKENDPDEIFSYCDFNKFDGRSYEELGMKFIGYTGPDMKYIINGNVVNRQPSKYKEIKKYVDYRIYGAGSKKYLWTKS